MKKAPLLLAGTAFLFLLTVSLHAQGGAVGGNAPTTGGCVNSPENPTAVLAVVGSAGAIFFSRRRR